jgi:hypothetical protein
MRESPMLLPRFSSKDFSKLSSVKLPLDLQLNPQPAQRHLPVRLLVELLALRFDEVSRGPGRRQLQVFSVRAPFVFFGISSFL